LSLTASLRSIPLQKGGPFHFLWSKLWSSNTPK
jgi:hypothetical protein